MSEFDAKALYDKLDELVEAIHASHVERAVMSDKLEQSCKAITDLHRAVMGPDGLATRLTRAEGKISVGQWVLVTFGTALIGCLVGAIWALAIRV
jgi:hypothetical protein